MLLYVISASPHLQISGLDGGPTDKHRGEDEPRGQRPANQERNHGDPFNDSGAVNKTIKEMFMYFACISKDCIMQIASFFSGGFVELCNQFRACQRWYRTTSDGPKFMEKNSIV